MPLKNGTYSLLYNKLLRSLISVSIILSVSCHSTLVVLIVICVGGVRVCVYVCVLC